MTPEMTQMLMSLGWIVLTFALFYFVLIRPQKKREKEEKAMLNALKVGDNVITIGGITGKIVSIKDDLPLACKMELRGKEKAESIAKGAIYFKKQVANSVWGPRSP